MKCDQLTIYDDQWYDKSEVDAAIAELKEKLHDVDNQWNEQCKEIAELQAENERLKAQIEEIEHELHRMRRRYECEG